MLIGSKKNTLFTKSELLYFQNVNKKGGRPVFLVGATAVLLPKVGA